MPLDVRARLARIRTVADMARAFEDETVCRQILEALVWPKGRFCPACGSVGSTLLADRTQRPTGRSRKRTKRPGLYQCADCACQFTATSGTPLHATKLPLKTWLHALWLVLQSDKGVSSVRLAEAIGATQATAWRMGHALRLLMADHNRKLEGVVEIDEVKVGGKPRKDPSDPNARSGKQGHTTKKPALIAVERPQDDRAGRVQAVPLTSMTQEVVHGAVRDVVAPDAHIMSDGGTSLAGLAAAKVTEAGETVPPVAIAQDTVTHSKQEYVRGIVHSNSVEGMNDRIRRTVVGVFHHIDPKHAQGYFDEVGFRWSQRFLAGTANRHTRKGRLVARKVWDRVPPSEQMGELLARAAKRRLRRTKAGSIEILSGRRPNSAAAAPSPAAQAPQPIDSPLDDDAPF